ncbi:MAG: division/cell wall cluster transcriptional repressor MraZ [Ruminococcaceae bacterium]|nr:division/cell wall cluster transcriptional repressor MraZ [Oscillospiraceae bacterium]
MSLCGEFRHALDAKNRLFIPAKHREVFGESVMIVRDLENKCLLVYSKDEWENYRATVLSKIPASQRHDVNRFLYRNSLESGYDSQGRVLLTPELCRHAELERGTTVIVGCGDYSEIWTEENYQAKISEENAEDIVALLKQYDT